MRLERQGDLEGLVYPAREFGLYPAGTEHRGWVNGNADTPNIVDTV